MAETPSKQLSARLDRLEKDLQLLSTMQTFIVSDTVPLSYNPPTRDFPERDINTGYRDTSSRSSSERTTCQHDPSVGKENAPSNKSGPRRVNKPKVVKSMEVVGVSSFSTVSRSTLTDEPFPSNLQLEVSEALKSERKRRVDVEDSARIVALKLQQFEDELKKERESKQMLLVGMLQCKNKISGQEMLMKEREVELKQAQEESASSQLKLERITAENIATVEKLKQLIDLLKTEKKVLQAENRKMAAEKREIESRIEESCKQSAIKEQSIQTQEQKLNAKLNLVVAKCAQLDKDRKDLSQEMQSTLKKLELSEKELHESQEEFKKLQAESSRELVLKDCVLDKLKSDLLQQKERYELQTKTSQTVVSKTKSLILRIQKEKDDLRNILVTYKQENEYFHNKTVQAVQKYEELYQNYEGFKSKYSNILNSNRSLTEKLKLENTRFKAQVKKLEDEKAIQLKLTVSTETDFFKEKKSFEEKLKNLENENKDLTVELTRYTDNFRVLQKISEDQTKTIQTLRNEKDEQRKIKFSLETEIRERISNETNLLRKLEQGNKTVIQLEEALQEYQRKISALEEELHEHNCEEFVETSFKRQLSQMESEVKERYEQWKKSLKDAKSERDKAIRNARYHEKAAEETKNQCESGIQEITSKAKQDFQKLKIDVKRSLAEKDAKIMDLESSLEQHKLQSQQLQRSLRGRIQQLQCALNAYVTSTTGSTFGNPSLFPDPFLNFA